MDNAAFTAWFAETGCKWRGHASWDDHDLRESYRLFYADGQWVRQISTCHGWLTTARQHGAHEAAALIRDFLMFQKPLPFFHNWLMGLDWHRFDQEAVNAALVAAVEADMKEKP